MRALLRGEAGTPVAEICRKLDIGRAKYFRWKKSCGSLGVAALRELRRQLSLVARPRRVTTRRSVNPP